MKHPIRVFSGQDLTKHWGVLDKDKGFVKAQIACAVRLHRMNCREVEDQSSGRFTLHRQTVGYAPPTIDTATGKTEREIRYYITSLRPDAERLNASIRQHWGIENKLHWVLDVGFREDLDRKRASHAAQNFSVLNRIALNPL